MATTVGALAWSCASSPEEQADGDADEVTFAHAETLSCISGCEEIPPLMVGSEVDIMVRGLDCLQRYSARSVDPEVISVTLELPELPFWPSDCDHLLNEWVPILHAHPHAEGAPDVQVLDARGSVRAGVVLQARVEARIEVTVWRPLSEGEFEQLVPEVVEGLPTWMLQVGEIVILDVSILDSTGTEMIGYRALDWTCSNPEVLAGSLPVAEALSAGRAELIAETPNGEHRFVFMVED